jgi:hypothetical protein
MHNGRETKLDSEARKDVAVECSAEAVLPSASLRKAKYIPKREILRYSAEN